MNDIFERIVTTLPRRRFLAALGSGLLLPAISRVVLADETEAADEAESEHFVSEHVDPAKLWDGDRQLVLAYKRGEQLGEPCRQLDAVRDELPVKIVWRLPPEWVKAFPTIHFEVSSRQWMKFDGWRDAAEFTRYYRQFNPPPKTAADLSPFREFAATYDGPRWSWPGKITEHLRDPHGAHRFSQFELSGLSVSDKKRLHSAHHAGVIEPGKRPPTPEPGHAGTG